MRNPLTIIGAVALLFLMPALAFAAGPTAHDLQVSIGTNGTGTVTSTAIRGYVEEILVDVPGTSQTGTVSVTANRAISTIAALSLATNVVTADYIVRPVVSATDGTGSAITLKQGTTSTASTALAFTSYFYKADIGTNTWVAGTASSNTFTTGTASASGIYAIDVDVSSMTATYKFLRMDCAAAAGATAGIFYIPYQPRYQTAPASMVDVKPA